MEMLSGSHPAVRCEFVFTSLLARIHRDQAHSPWTSQLKCMLLLDRYGFTYAVWATICISAGKWHSCPLLCSLLRREKPSWD
jgi:hypothetical protein